VEATAQFLSTFGRVFGELSSDAPVTLDERRIEAMVEALSEVAAPDVECAMIASEGMPTVSYRGAEGFRKAWTDWLSGFERISFQLEEAIEFDGGVVVMARQVGTTRFGVDLEQPSAMVSWLDGEGKLTRAEFHLDRDRALRSAGIDPEGHGAR
jgi:hypothetical protein